jgi:hypothetical protein
MMFSLFFRSKGGHLSQVSLVPNIDRTLRVVKIDRWYQDLTMREIEDLRHKFEKEYEQQLSHLEMEVGEDNNRDSFRASLLHPMYQNSIHLMNIWSPILLENPQCKVSTKIE